MEDEIELEYVQVPENGWGEFFVEAPEVEDAAVRDAAVQADPLGELNEPLFGQNMVQEQDNFQYEAFDDVLIL